MSLFITFEGGEGSGKSSVMKEVAKRLAADGYEIIETREPGGTPIAEQIRNVILDKANTKMDARTEALLYAASRRQHLVEKVWPALEEGKIVMSDRFLDSSLAYQGVARGLGVDNVLNVNLFATEGKYPDLTLFFDIEPELGLARIAANKGREVNRLDLEALSFHHMVRNAFLDLSKRYADRYVKIDASKTFEEVIEDDMNWATEHEVGIIDGVPAEIVEGLRSNFTGECSEVGMYLAMSRVAYREGYPEIGLYWEKAAYEEAEHAAKFAEMLGEVLTNSTKKNLEMRVAAENGACEGKFALAKKAKAANLDAIHDTVHEMAKDEARHGRAFKGLLDRYFGEEK